VKKHLYLSFSGQDEGLQRSLVLVAMC